MENEEKYRPLRKTTYTFDYPVLLVKYVAKKKQEEVAGIEARKF